MHNGLSSHNMFLLCASLNRCIEEEEGHENNIFIGCRPLTPGSCTNVGLMFAAMHPGNAVIVQYNGPGEGMGHYVSLWQQRNDRGDLWFFYYNSIGTVKLFAGDSIAHLAEDIENRGGQRSPYSFNGEYTRVLFILALPERSPERNNAILYAIKIIKQ